MQATGNLHKMHTREDSEITYSLTLNDTYIELNDFIGQEISLDFTGKINCISCGKLTKKAFGQGFCYTCFLNSPMNSECIIKPELCLAHEGKGRDPEWEERNHNKPHYVYLAVTAKIKVGVTRCDQIPTRWIDQGAWKAILIAKTNNRQQAGFIEIALKNTFGDKTPWQAMLKDTRNYDVDIENERDKAIDLIPKHLKKFAIKDSQVMEIEYPVDEYPEKVKSLNFDKTPSISGILNGIRGQYLLLNENRVLNIRKFSGYEITFSAID